MANSHLPLFAGEALVIRRTRKPLPWHKRRTVSQYDIERRAALRARWNQIGRIAFQAFACLVTTWALIVAFSLWTLH